MGPTQNYGFYSGVSKCLLSLNMLFGRLEIFPLLLLFSTSTWRRKA
ncbi:hypothetical protein LJC07_08000 [Christensenellaceae bacterium OttesenSCG-928-L17]|nr:hypothetical protein [Christensenellaceae bacterium OttesenSCG-928-L17]